MTRLRLAFGVLAVGLLAGMALELFWDPAALRTGPDGKPLIEPIPVARVAAILAKAVGIGKAEDTRPNDSFVVLQVRMPRMLTAILVGGALALCGAVMQSVFQNPMADPSLLGVANGGALGAVLAMGTGYGGYLFLKVPVMVWFALGGGLAAAAAVYLVAVGIGRLNRLTLILSGIAIGFLLSSATMLVLVMGEEWDLHKGLFWLMGSVEAANWSQLRFAGPVVLVGGGLLMLFHRELDILMLGDHGAASLGVAVGSMRFFLLALAAVVTAMAVSISGVIAFVGLVVPHVLRLAVGPLSRWLLPASFLGGAVFILFADTISRSIDTPTPIQLGIISSFLGVPLLLFLLARHARGANS